MDVGSEKKYSREVVEVVMAGVIGALDVIIEEGRAEYEANPWTHDECDTFTTFEGKTYVRGGAKRLARKESDFRTPSGLYIRPRSEECSRPIGYSPSQPPVSSRDKRGSRLRSASPGRDSAASGERKPAR